jgi:acyl-CoA thioesterase
MWGIIQKKDTQTLDLDVSLSTRGLSLTLTASLDSFVSHEMCSYLNLDIRAEPALVRHCRDLPVPGREGEASLILLHRSPLIEKVLGGGMVNKEVENAIRQQVAKEPYARKLGLEVVKLEPGYAIVEMALDGNMANIFDMTHGGAIFSLIDEAFEISCNSHGTVAVALSMTVTYHNTPTKVGVLRAESKEIYRSRKTATYDIKVTENQNTLIASCQALAYRKQEKLPFL